MRVHRLLTLGPSEEALWVKVYVHPIGERWVAMILRDDAPPPGCEELRGTAFFGDTPAAAKELALRYLGGCVEQN